MMEEHDTALANRGRKACTGCAAAAPPVEGEFELIREGWRLTLRKDDAGRKKSDWWCPACFAKNRPASAKR